MKRETESGGHAMRDEGERNKEKQVARERGEWRAAGRDKRKKETWVTTESTRDKKKR